MISKLAETENRYKVEIEKVGVMLTYETRSLTKVYEIVLLNPGYHTCNIYYNYIYIECFLIQHIYFLLMYVYTEVLYKDAASYNSEKFRIPLPKRKREDKINFILRNDAIFNRTKFRVNFARLKQKNYFFQHVEFSNKEFQFFQN